MGKYIKYGKFAYFLDSKFLMKETLFLFHLNVTRLCEIQANVLWPKAYRFIHPVQVLRGHLILHRGFKLNSNNLVGKYKKS